MGVILESWSAMQEGQAEAAPPAAPPVAAVS
jgi:hypothetical protein